MTYDELEWDPHHRRFQEQEEAMTDHVGHALEPLDHQSKENRFVNSFATSKPRAENTARYKSKVCAVLSDISNTLNDDTFVKALKENVNLPSSQTTGRANKITAEKLSQTWSIGLQTAKRTLKTTTQRGVGSVANPSIERCLWTNDRQLRYRRLNTNLYTYTMFSNTPSTRGNTGGQIYTNDMDWTRFYPMKSKSQAHETLSVLMSRDGVPATLISDGAKEQVKGQFWSKARQAGIHCKETEPHSQWQNRAESAI